MTKRKCMTEAEWLSQGDLWDTPVWYGPLGMLKFLRECKRVRCKVTDRKLWLFACACCYRMWDLITNERYREAVRVTELRADRLVSKKAWWAALRGLLDETAFNRMLLPEDDRTWDDQVEVGISTALWLLTQKEMNVEGTISNVCVAIYAAEAAEMGLPPPSVYFQRLTPPVPRPRGDGEVRWQCAALRDIFTPFRKLPAVDPAWLAWNNGTVPKLAQVIYEERRFADLPILADALEEAGCSDAGILDHFRRAGEHVRGCWALDLILGKE